MANEYNVTTNEIMDFLKEHMVTKTELHDEISNLRAEFKEDMSSLRAEFKEDMGSLRAEFKEDMGSLRAEFKEDMGRLRSDFIDYLDKRLLDLKGDLVVIMKSEDRKLGALIEILVHKNILTASEAHGIIKMEPFPQRV